MDSDKPTSPIERLLPNVSWAFENPDPAFPGQLKAAVEVGAIHSQIALRMDLVAPTAPSLKKAAAGDIPEIHLHITFLELLWASIYGWMVLYEEGVQKPMIAGTFDGSINFQTLELNRAGHLIEWVKAMRTDYRPWPTNMPAPDRYANEQERWYGEKANRVFQEAASFCLVHEFVHARHDHFKALAGYEGEQRQLVMLELEKDADNQAFTTLVPQGIADLEKLSKGWAILSVMLTSFYLADGIQGVFQRGHLPLHHRLDHLRRSLQFQEEQHQFYFDYLCTTFLGVFLRELGVTDGPKVFDDAQEALEEKLNLLDQYFELGSFPLSE